MADPRSRPGVSGRRTAEGGPTPKGVLPRAQVLVVDDEPAICRALEVALTHAGFEVKTTTSGGDAQAILSARPIDVLVVDLLMPEMRGDVLYHLATALQPHLRQATIFLTGDVTKRAQELIAACGGRYYIAKPFALGDVIETVAALAPRSRTASA